MLPSTGSVGISDGNWEGELSTSGKRRHKPSDLQGKNGGSRELRGLMELFVLFCFLFPS